MGLKIKEWGITGKFEYGNPFFLNMYLKFMVTVGFEISKSRFTCNSLFFPHPTGLHITGLDWDIVKKIRTAWTVKFVFNLVLLALFLAVTNEMVYNTKLDTNLTI